MRALPVVLLTVLGAGCHFDKLFNDSGGGAASRGGAGPPAKDVPAVNGIAIFADLSIDQPGISDYTLVARDSPLDSTESAPFSVGGP